jgi:type III secretion protein J
MDVGMVGAVLRRLRNGLAVVVSLLAVSACSPRVDLFTGVADAEANEIIVALRAAKIEAVKRAGKTGALVTVDAEQAGAALAALQQLGLPRARFDGMGRVFKKEGMISSPLEERVRYVHALSEELAHTLTYIDGVVAARVHVVLPERETVSQAAIPATASVFMKHRDEVRLDMMHPQIRRMVAFAIPGLVEDRVTITAVPSQSLTAAPEHAEATDGSLRMQVAAGGPSRLTIALIIMAALILALLAVLVMQGRRRRVSLDG